mgnify:CR=1 FL=1
MAGSETGVNRDQEIPGRPLSAASVLASLYVTRRTQQPTCPQGFLPMLNLKTYLIKEHVGMMKLHGAEHGMADLADKISITRNGRYVVADRQAKADKLAVAAFAVAAVEPEPAY